MYYGALDGSYLSAGLNLASSYGINFFFKDFSAQSILSPVEVTPASRIGAKLTGPLELRSFYTTASTSISGRGFFGIPRDPPIGSDSV